MQTFSPLRHRLDEFRLAAHDLRVWVIEVLCELFGHSGNRSVRLWLRQRLIEARQQTRILIFHAMVAQLSFSRRIRPLHRHPPTGRGFRFQEKRFGPVALFTRGIGLKTLRDIRRALENFDAVVRRALRRLPEFREIAGSIVAVRPLALTRISQIFAARREAADTS